MRGTPHALVCCVLLFVGCASSSPVATVQAYREARARGDVTAEQAFLAPGARMYFETREGEGEPLKAGRGGRWAHWDEFFHSRTVYSDWAERDGSVSAVAHETNDFYRLLEWEPAPYRMTWRLDSKGRIRDALLEPIPGKTTSRMSEFKEWASLNHPEELEYLMPGGRIDPTGDRAERFKAILTEWRSTLQAAMPAPPGVLVDIGGQRLHVNCSGSGSPTVLLESGTGDVSVIWSLVQPEVAKFTRVCSYDRAGYAWSDPGNRPRTFAQLALELRTALQKLQVDPPYVLAGQSYGGLVIRGFFASYPRDVAGMVMVDAVHEDQQVVYGGQPHRIREAAKGRTFPPPRIARGPAPAGAAGTAAEEQPLEPPLDRMPPAAQTIWRWAESQPQLQESQSAEMDWSPEELARMHAERMTRRNTLGELPLVVLARTDGGYASGMSVSAEALEQERRELQADLARLSARGKLVFAAHSGHNLHLEDPQLVVRSIREVVEQSRR